VLYTGAVALIKALGGGFLKMAAVAVFELTLSEQVIGGLTSVLNLILQVFIVSNRPY
jgi:hypothetical protein